MSCSRLSGPWQKRQKIWHGKTDASRKSGQLAETKRDPLSWRAHTWQVWQASQEVLIFCFESFQTLWCFVPEQSGVDQSHGQTAPQLPFSPQIISQKQLFYPLLFLEWDPVRSVFTKVLQTVELVNWWPHRRDGLQWRLGPARCSAPRASRPAYPRQRQWGQRPSHPSLPPAHHFHRRRSLRNSKFPLQPAAKTAVNAINVMLRNQSQKHATWAFCSSCRK